MNALISETPLSGLSDADVALRVARGQTNASGERTSRSLPEILRANVVTRFNVILGVLLVAILAAGQPQDALFGIVPVANSLIGIVQELRAKRTLDRLAVLSAPRARVVRDSATRDVAVDDVVLDDIVELRAGDQIVADGVVRASTGMQVDESLLTGESQPVEKEVGSQVLSGSFVASGSGRYQTSAVGAAAYARTLTAEARRFKITHSDLVAGINQIVQYATWLLFPVGALLLASRLHAGAGWTATVVAVVAALVGMVPQGLVLLTSIAFGVAAVTLARRSVLVQQLPAVEGLARVDVVCFDKTGTLTDGTIVFDRLEQLDGAAPVAQALAALADDEAGNATLLAIAQAFPANGGWTRSRSVPFSSARKWSGAGFGANGTWVLGAPEMVLSEAQHHDELRRGADLAATGQRVLVLAQTNAELDGDTLPDGMRPVALVLFAEQVRSDAAATIAYFAAQGVAMKVISGDSPRTVGAVAARVGVPDAGTPVDARELPDDPEQLAAALEQHSVFGRVTPRQKQSMVTALQARGHTVAMTGDGVNDVLALKLADIGIAMGSGAAATKAVAELVLLDGRFASMPGVVAEGRRVTANIERVANAFITKTVWATALAIAAGITFSPYPLLPRDLTIIDTLTIGVPAFFLALAPNLRRYIPGFVGRVLRFTIPAGLVVAVAGFGAYWLARSHGLPLMQQRTAATLVMLMLSLCVLVFLALPLTWRRALLIAVMVLSFLVLFPIAAVRTFYALELPGAVMVQTMLIGVGGIAALITILLLLRRAGLGPAAASPPSGAGAPAGG
ncbi:MAG TPA: HAD-IC family P-type ATPase [Candidatus Dormibacteraeota bacterium]|jgi:cation-transporting ATPase E|nr:HAD-IC family P-type ATPase [Candidatus Dormibacteraeota bacterium]